jgi:hypothetical protein
MPGNGDSLAVEALQRTDHRERFLGNISRSANQALRISMHRRLEGQDVGCADGRMQETPRSIEGAAGDLCSLECGGLESE